jgi:hypothetical protein
VTPNDPNGLDRRGFLYLRLGRLDEAIADCDAALKINPKLAGSIYGRGPSKRKKGDQGGGDADIADKYSKYGMN